MKEQLLLLENQLRNRLNDLYHTLHPGLLNDNLAVLESLYKVTVPADIRQLYRWRNGQDLQQEKAFLNGFYFFPLKEMLEHYKNQKEKYGFEPGQLPLLGDFSGRYRSFICYDTYGHYRGHKGEIFQLNSTEPFDEDIAQGLEQFFTKINEHLSKMPDKKLNNEIVCLFNGRQKIKQASRLLCYSFPETAGNWQ